ncbi:hypothetical protein PALB_34280 [Pseudoalteromonas luteoviolacea B = ATCC 29581]|nr:hypothetical protein PALB_34280 [Pseudoalteromonas luteoviolacea B = ATCC 29581]
MNTLKIIALSTVLFASNLALANNDHKIGLELQGGNATYKSSSQDGDGVSSVYLYYSYQFDPLYSLEVGFIRGGESENWNCTDINDYKIECNKEKYAYFGLGADELNFHNFVVATRMEWDLTTNSHLYAKAGLHHYDYNIQKNNSNIASENGISYLVEGGWEYQWQNGIGANIALRHVDMGHLDITTWGAGISYRF